MSAILIKLVNMSITAGWLIVAVILFRRMLKKAPKSLICILWALVGLRLICPFSLESVVSLIPSAQTIPGDFVTSEIPVIESGIQSVDLAVNDRIFRELDSTVGQNVPAVQRFVDATAVVWFIGVAGMFLYSLISVWLLRRRVRVSMPIEEGVYVSDDVDSPFILGIIRPKIYLPTGLPEAERGCVLAHERIHLKRKDHWWKAVGFALLAVFWFNPLVWVAYVLLCRDIETACDEQVIKEMEEDEKRFYSAALLTCSTHRRTVMVCPLAFGEVGVKNRIRSVLNYQKPTFLGIAAAVIVSALVGVCFMTDPLSGPKEVLAMGDRIDCEVNVAWANWSDSEVLCEKATYVETLNKKYPSEVPIYQIDTREQLEQFKSDMAGILTIDGKLDGTASFNEICTGYDEAFFADNTLFVIYVEANSGTPRYYISDVGKSGDELNIVITKRSRHSADCMMGGWYLTLAVDRDTVKDCKGFNLTQIE